MTAGLFRAMERIGAGREKTKRMGFTFHLPLLKNSGFSGSQKLLGMECTVPGVIVLAAFDKTENGDLVAAFDPREMANEEAARTEAAALATRHAGVIAWARYADPETGAFGDPIVLFSCGQRPEVE